MAVDCAAGDDGTIVVVFVLGAAVADHANAVAVHASADVVVDHIAVVDAAAAMVDDADPP